MMPVTIGPTIPEKLPTAFCTPTHVPEARGPANICATAYKFVDPSAEPAPARDRSRAILIGLLAKARPKIASDGIAWLATIIQRRQKASDRPERVHQSEK